VVVLMLQYSDLEELERTVEPSWPKLVEPLEKIVDPLEVVWGMINHIRAVKDTVDLRAATGKVLVISLACRWFTWARFLKSLLK